MLTKEIQVNKSLLISFPFQKMVSLISGILEWSRKSNLKNNLTQFGNHSLDWIYSNKMELENSV